MRLLRVSMAGSARAWCLPEYGLETCPRGPAGQPYRLTPHGWPTSTEALFQQQHLETTENTNKRTTRQPGKQATTAVCAVASTLPTVCAAADNSALPTVVVKYADLNLSNPEGVTALYRRITAAARDVCQYYDIRSGSSLRPGATDACVRKALQDAVTKVGHPALSALYNAKHPQPVPITVASAGTR